ncbi:MAG TPA: 16S rRNA (guanine(966)-N(2))-methyltransferase RsmD [Propionicimonas sp.]|jgi:16S rRNA (guanine966-N2)-methyltransferase|nr:16S rRNA (guanine(966)-N(2))-methyltransferase RsmD [Propionicimonas sp.]
MSRIIAGACKGQRLVMPGHSRTRPTTDRVREAAFSLIADWAGTAGEPATVALAGLAFLDLYAGSGAVGLEAASRGAAPVWAVESDRATAEVARRNAASTGLPLTVHSRTVAAVLAAAPQPFDVVWADPPYEVASADLDGVLARLLEGGWVAPRGLLVVERSARSVPPVWPVGVQDSWRRVYGETSLHLAMKDGA